MKRLFAIIISVFMLIGIAACKNAENSSSDVTATLSSKNDFVSTDITPSEESTSTETSSVVSDVPSKETGTSSVASQKPVQNTPLKPSTPTKPAEKVEILTFDHFMPSVIASKCEHTYVGPTCTTIAHCTKCNERRTTGNQNYAGHYYINGKCKVCGFVSSFANDKSKFVTFNADFYSLNQEITVEVYLTNLDTVVNAYPCVTIYKYVGCDKWEPYEGMYEVGEFFALEAKPGGIITSDTGVRYGRWDIMSNEILQINPNVNVENELLSRLIRRFKITIKEVGEYKVEVCDAPNGIKNTETNNQYMTISY